MKKLITMLAVVALAGFAQGDILVTFATSYGIADQGGGALLADGEQALVQLIYAGGDGLVDGAAQPGGALAGGDDVIFAQFLSPAATAGDFVTEYGVWGTTIESLVGPAGGTVYGRIFQDDAAAAGTFYYEGHLAVAPNQDATATPLPTPGLTYDLGQGAFVLADQEVVPEPATIGLMGIAGLGMYLARRKTRS